jgi:uncharacterized lipoprotein YddW (UPF0748 family)
MSRLLRSTCVVACLMVLGISCTGPSYRSRRPAARPPVPAPTPTPKPVTELRGVWVSDTTKLDWETATRDLQQAGFNTMYVNFASAGAAFYPKSRALPSVVPDAPDAVAHGIELAHRRGLAVHAKLIAFFMFKAPADFQRRMVKVDRVMHGPEGRPIEQTGFNWICPSLPANRQQLQAAVTEMLTRYPVDGLQFDYIRFFEEPSCYCAHCREEYERVIGQRVNHWPADVLGGVQTERFKEWQRELISGYVAELSALARKLRPGLKVSAAVFYDLKRARQERAQDWKSWLDRGDLDYVCTMTYTPSLQEFGQRVGRQLTWANRNKLAVGIGSYKLERPSDLAGQIDLTRRLETAGFVLFSYDDAATRDFLPKLGEKSALPR